MSLGLIVPDASCTVPLGSAIVQSNGNLKVAQTFTALHSGGLTSAQTTVTNPPASTVAGNWQPRSRRRRETRGPAELGPRQPR